MSAIQAISAMYYTSLANCSAYNMMSTNNTRMGFLNNSTALSFGSLGALAETDTQLELNMITNSLEYQMAKTMLKNIKQQQKEDAKNFSAFA